MERSFDGPDRCACAEDLYFVRDRVGLVAVVVLLEAEDAGGEDAVAGVQDYR